MPKINVYLPDELAEAVRESGLPVSAICQRALEQSVRRVTAIRETTLGDLETDDPTERLARFTERTRAAIRLGIEQARADGAAGVGTEHLLRGLLAEGTNLALHVLRAAEIEPDQVARDLADRSATRATDGTPAARFTGPAANVLELTVTEAIALGHNYVGCEHLLLGLVAEPDGAAGQVLRSRGAELRLTRRTVVAALAGYVHLRGQGVVGGQSGGDGSALITAMRAELRPLTERLERLERHAGIADEAGPCP